MIKVYGSKLCPDCRNTIVQFDEAGINYKFFDICTDLSLLKEFLSIRDHSTLFDQVKKNKGLGIPCIILEDGTVTLNPEDVVKTKTVSR
ncbi:glutaredoxin domain-containing protein [Sporolactobacillus vineae]|uniref:glutaredoxin domain-containing protein n=1 Tax=Sporolactobacillus vineae TaxID=444463 RepID=UPI000287D670|nr:glutaredoxin domain-containing protein [Sporolactobacillus vineae]